MALKFAGFSQIPCVIHFLLNSMGGAYNFLVITFVR